MKWVVGQDFHRSQVPTHGGSSGPLEPPAGSYKNNCKLNSMLAQSLNKKKKIKENLIMIQSSRTMLNPSVNNVYGKENKKRKTTKKSIKIILIKQQGFFTCNFRTPGGSGQKHAAAGWAKRPTQAVPTHGSPAPPGLDEGPVGRNKDHSRPAQPIKRYVLQGYVTP